MAQQAKERGARSVGKRDIAAYCCAKWNKGTRGLQHASGLADNNRPSEDEPLRLRGLRCRIFLARAMVMQPLDLGAAAGQIFLATGNIGVLGRAHRLDAGLFSNRLSIAPNTIRGAA
jgi:hypothetical protein